MFALFVFMAKHIYLTNADGGYFYRIYPKIPSLKFKPDNDVSVQAELFNPPPETSGSSVLRNIYGKFIDKYNDKGLTIELLSSGSYCITCNLTGQQENRILQSKIIVVVNDTIFNYPFIKDKIYSISINEVKEITL